MSDHPLAQKGPALASALQDRLSRLWDAIRTGLIPALGQRIELVRKDIRKIRGKPKAPQVCRPILFIPGTIDRGPADGRSIVVVASDHGYRWQIRRYGSPLLDFGCDQSFDKAEAAWTAGQVALDRHRAARPEF